MPSIKILDCTLRDGGYINNWEFGEENIETISKELLNAGIDFIEYGFLSDNHIFNKDKTLFSSANKIPNIQNCLNPTLMVNYGEVDFDNYKNTTPILELRLSFKPYQLSELSEYVEPLIKNYVKFSLNPMHISLYSENDLLNLADITNEIKPACLVGVDTMGIMKETDTKNIFELLDKNLDKNIPLGFHSHNNLNLSMKNTETFISLNSDRTLIIDSSLGGFARGGGLLSTKDICALLNNKSNSHYDLNRLSELEDFVKNIYANNIDSRDKELYIISAEMKCHPNYAKQLQNKNLSNREIREVLKNIPQEKRPYYDKTLTEKLINNCV